MTAAAHEIDVRGLLTIRLDGAGVADVRAVERQLGLPARPLAAPPAADADLTIRYHDRLALGKQRRRVGPPDVSWTEAGLAVSTRRPGPAKWALVPFEQVGRQTAVDAERGIGAIPFLATLLNLTLLTRGVLALHGSAFIYRGVGVVAAGWSGSGKTEALLAATSTGGTMVADEWSLLTQGRTVFGLPTRVSIEPHHLSGRLRNQDAATPGARWALRRAGAVSRVLNTFPSRAIGRLPGGRLVHKAVTELGTASLAPSDLFGTAGCAESLSLERVVWMVPRDAGAGTEAGLELKAVSTADLARRMAVAHVHHRLSFLDAYWRFRYAFPDRVNDLVESMEQRERELAEVLLAEVPAFLLEHPAGAAPATLVGALRAATSGQPAAADVAC